MMTREQLAEILEKQEKILLRLQKETEELEDKFYDMKQKKQLRIIVSAIFGAIVGALVSKYIFH